jgi:hypothetical protein
MPDETIDAVATAAKGVFQNILPYRNIQEHIHKFCQIVVLGGPLWQSEFARKPAVEIATRRPDGDGRWFLGQRFDLRNEEFKELRQGLR